MSISPNLSHLAPLIGTWRGRGRGEYPTIHSFEYADEVQFIDVGKPFLLYVQKTRIGDEPMHTETGYLRAPNPQTVELVVAVPTGQAELGAGTCTVDGETITIETDCAVTNTPTAKQVDRIVRRIECAGDDLVYEMRMAAVKQPLTLHLRSALKRS